MNATEKRFLSEMMGQHWLDGDLIFPQAFKLEFPDKDVYEPDFLVMRPWKSTPEHVLTTFEIVIYEIKGAHVGQAAWSSGGLQKYKRAALAWPQFHFRMWEWVDREWLRIG